MYTLHISYKLHSDKYIYVNSVDDIVMHIIGCNARD